MIRTSDPACAPLRREDQAELARLGFVTENLPHCEFARRHFVVIPTHRGRLRRHLPVQRVERRESTAGEMEKVEARRISRANA
jgi:hypothetical protein